MTFIYRYPDGTRQALGGSLDDVPVANATERTAPRRRVEVDRSALVALLDAWQAHCEAQEPSLCEPAGYVEVEHAAAWESLIEALGAFADGVDL